jgi:hypothetical protein
MRNISRRRIFTIIHSVSHDYSTLVQWRLIVYSNWPYIPPTKTDQFNGTRTPPMQTQAVVLGLGSMFNHSTLQQNVGWERDVKNLLVTYTTLRDIKEGEELCISYGPRLTFKDVEEESLDTSPEDWTEVLNIIDLID